MPDRMVEPVLPFIGINFTAIIFFFSFAMPWRKSPGTIQMSKMTIRY